MKTKQYVLKEKKTLNGISDTKGAISGRSIKRGTAEDYNSIRRALLNEELISVKLSVSETYSLMHKQHKESCDMKNPKNR